ncbi:sensor histidine kinase [Dactylosporangium sucinum]|uniref:histidine kinase n=1 Tax=Dactylosporangium sucinum TaxID=1424081 RepID=A0A917WLW0_9ACTN|nr:histidine kinase [Dactylosporangium sucinum]GGM15058.1 two-component sensor histidine kinase [Dactylosporangium sucinum]
MKPWRWVAVGLAVLVGLCAVPLTGLAGILPAVAGVGAVVALIVPQLALPAAVLSLAVDGAYQGPPQPPGLWMPVEFTALGLLLVLVSRRGTVLQSILVGLALTLLPLRMTLHVPRNRFDGSVLLVAAAFAVAVACAGLGLYLRYGDDKRRRAEGEARREQRLGLARDLHDLVAHEVTAIVVQAQAAQLERREDADNATYSRIEEAGQRALDAMDRLVRTMRGYGLADIPGVVARFDASGPTRATLVMDPDVRIGSAAGTAGYHVVVEALTNVRRHAPDADTVTVTLDRDGRLTIVDSGSPRKETSRNLQSETSERPNKETSRSRVGGSGLAGLRERVPGLAAGPYRGGWRVTCDLSRSADVPERPPADA